MLLEPFARPLLIAHALLGGALVALTTHHLVSIIRSRGVRRRGEPLFALLASGFFILNFTLGCLIYPTYRVRVRAEYFNHEVARETERQLRRASAKAPPLEVEPPNLARAVRLFDGKEHLVALGVLASAALFWLSRRADPTDPSARPLYLGLAWFSCATSWIGALTGLYTASLRAIGAA